MEAPWLGSALFTAEGLGSIPGQGSKIPQAVRCGPSPPKEVVDYVNFLPFPPTLEGSSPEPGLIHLLSSWEIAGQY